MGMLQEFRDFAVKGNVMDLAVGVIIGAAFGKIVDSLVKDIIMPIIGVITGGGTDFTNKFILLGNAMDKDGKAVAMTYEALSKAGVPMIAWGNFLTIVLNFILLAFAVFMLVKFMNKAKEKAKLNLDAAPAGPPEDVVLLREIRDALKK